MKEIIFQITGSSSRVKLGCRPPGENLEKDIISHFSPKIKTHEVQEVLDDFKLLTVIETKNTLDVFHHFSKLVKRNLSEAIEVLILLRKQNEGILTKNDFESLAEIIKNSKEYSNDSLLMIKTRLESDQLKLPLDSLSFFAELSKKAGIYTPEVLGHAISSLNRLNIFELDSKDSANSLIQIMLELSNVFDGSALKEALNFFETIFFFFLTQDKDTALDNITKITADIITPLFKELQNITLSSEHFYVSCCVLTNLQSIRYGKLELDLDKNIRMVAAIANLTSHIPDENELILFSQLCSLHPIEVVEALAEAFNTSHSLGIKLLICFLDLKYQSPTLPVHPAYIKATAEHGLIRPHQLNDFMTSLLLWGELKQGTLNDREINLVKNFFLSDSYLRIDNNVVTALWQILTTRLKMLNQDLTHQEKMEVFYNTIQHALEMGRADLFSKLLKNISVISE
ncbi:MAG: hypothetical protein KDD56_03505 [Bdellovibrionales bacterium]|nr:hypothetical protein [Bdellovibrionales bacterium]